MSLSSILYAKAQTLIPGGVNSPIRACRAVDSEPLFIERAIGSKLYDVDGRQYVDYVMSWGPMLLGHAHPAVHEAAKAALDAGADALVREATGLQARLDRLDRTERAAAEPAAVIGLEFSRAAVDSLVPPVLRASIDAKIAALEHKRFIHPNPRPESDHVYRFHHHLIRETVYNGLLKRARAALHVEYVRWADRVTAATERGREIEEILGYHLEAAYRYLCELGPVDDTGLAIARDGAQRLASAGRRAFARGDLHALKLLSQGVYEVALTFDRLPQGIQSELETLAPLRLRVVGGGCSGYSYSMDFEQGSAEGDAVFENQGVKIVVDPKSLPMIDNCQVDWVDGLTGAGFSISNPNAKGSCGCGSSFTV